METLLSRNQALLKARWPLLSEKLLLANSGCQDNGYQVEKKVNTDCATLVVNGIHLSSLYDPVKEAQLQAQLIPEPSEMAHVYGVGLGDLVRVLLTRQAIKQLHCYVFNPQALVMVLSYVDCTDWLSDPRVRLILADEQMPINVPFTLQMACLQLTVPSAKRLRDRLLLERETPYIHQQFAKRLGLLDQHIVANECYVRTDTDIATVFNQFKGQRMVVVGSGPSLADHYPALSQMQQNSSIIATSSAVQPLLNAGIIPDWVLVIDPSHDEVMALFAMDLSLLQATPLVYFPVVSPELLALWPGPRFTAYTEHSVYDSMAKRYPRGSLFCSGTVMHAATDLAVRMGASEVVLAGVDLSFPNGNHHVPDSQAPVIIAQEGEQHWTLNGDGESVLTTPSLLRFLYDLETYIKRHPEVRFVNLSKQGAMIQGTVYLTSDEFIWHG